ncbi:MAG: ABC transporter ATP-binding protein/permease [Spirochaetaceae bacterium]|jgi:ATP-binding cassette subfamily B protein|nr:ABC transporter ATP-binding protein/permease [Spirochaetaceae bacterium]
MSDFFSNDEIVKDYDAVIVRRIWSYIKKYKILVLFTAVSLLVSTAGELAVPVLEQRLVDEAIMPNFLRIDTRREKNMISSKAVQDLSKFGAMRGGRRINEYLFVPEASSLGITPSVREELLKTEILDGRQWYVFSADGREDALSVIERHKALFVFSDGAAAALPSADLAKIPSEEKKVIRRDDLNRISFIVLILFGILILVFAATFMQTWCSSLAGQKVMEDIRIALFRKTLFQSTSFLSSHPVGRIVTRLTGDVETINEFFTTVIVAFLKDISLMTGVLITLFALSPALAGVVLVCMPPVAAVSAVSRIRARDAFRRQRTASSAINSYLSERISGINIVQLFLGEKKSRAEYSRHNKELLNANLGEMFVIATFRPIVEFLSILTTAAVIAIGANMILNLQLSLGVLIAFINLIAMFYAPVMDISEKYTILQSAMAGGERVFKLLDTDEKITDAALPYMDEIQGVIEFNHVSFSYNRNEPVIRDLSFKVERGEKAAIVGYTGAGKTTVTNILTRLWDITGGTITIDGVSIKNIPLEALRRSVLPVLQDVFLFSGTISENISLGKRLPQDEIERAARAVYAHEFIEKLPLGYNTMLSEGASNISSGQRQLISFARVIAHNPAVVVLDEATSSIDTETESLIQRGIEKILDGRTSIVIAHRLSTIHNADRILVLSGGSLAEEGTHDELLKKNGLYASLYNLQFE